ncbi:MAG: hypothetical protein MUC86_00290 [Burkholderiaceae bacterium]|jgi:hypothetical protein|nr:hypothetical protein [Burkholderiaceae bacterium]
MKHRAAVLSVLLSLPALMPAATLACEPHLKGAGVQKIDGKRYVLAWRAVPPIHVSEFFTLEVALCSREGQPRVATLRVDAQMPEHQHGTNYRASVRPQGPDRFVVEGLLLHMPGHWEFTFDVNAGADRESLRTSVQVE